MTKIGLKALWLFIYPYILKILKFISIPFLIVWYIISWVLVILVAPIVLVIEFVRSFIRGDWKI